MASEQVPLTPALPPPYTHHRKITPDFGRLEAAITKRMDGNEVAETPTGHSYFALENVSCEYDDGVPASTNSSFANIRWLALRERFRLSRMSRSYTHPAWGLNSRA